jgi:DNA-directed RNA polymerase specialized sigma24 family protein
VAEEQRRPIAEAEDQLMNKINNLYSAWDADKTEDNLSTLLWTVNRRVINRYCLIDQNNCDDIAQRTVIVLWRTLIGDGLKPYSAQKGSFASFCATIARRERSDMLKHERLTATKHETLDGLVSDIEGQATGY